MSFNQFLVERAWTALERSDLTKRGGGRLITFKEKIDDGEEFATTKGLVVLNKSQVVDGQTLNSQQLIDYIRNTTGAKFTAIGKVKGREVEVEFPSQFFKTGDFGGRGKGGGTVAEDRALTKFRKVMQDQMEEDGTPFLKIEIGGRTVEAADIVKTKNEGPQRSSRDPKSDFSLIDINGTPVGFISHKDGERADSFQQYGGVTDKDIYNVIKDSAEFQQFVADLKSAYPDGLPRRTTLARPVKDKDVARKVIYGYKFKTSGDRGINNVDEFHQGTMKLTKVRGELYKIDSHHKETHPAIPTGEYSPIYQARYDSGRGNLGVKNSRIGVFAKAKGGQAF